MSGLRDYEQWHHAYDDPESGLSWRLQTVRGYIGDCFDQHPGPVRVVSSCAGDGRDLIGVLSLRDDAERVTATLIELHPGIAQRARDAAGAAGLEHLTVRTVDAGASDSYEGAVPADLVLLVGIFGNISDSDIERTVATAPQFCAEGATLLWSLAVEREERNDAVRGWFAEAGFVELDYVHLTAGSMPAVGVVRYAGEPQPLVPGRRLFTFIR